MHVYELTVPGTWLTGLAEDDRRDAESLLRLMTSSIEDAALALTLFDSTKALGATDGDATMAQWEQERSEEAAVRRELEQGLPADLTPEARFHAERELYDLARLEAKRRRWAAGQLPDSYKHRMPFLHAKSFVYAMDMIERSLSQLMRLSSIPDLTAIQKSWADAFPDLVHVRDSAHHAEDRVRGKRYDKPLPNKPVMNDAVHAPHGGVLIVDMLNENRYGGTLGDGSYGEVDLSVDSLRIAGQVVQAVLSAFTWTGPTDHRPS